MSSTPNFLHSYKSEQLCAVTNIDFYVKVMAGAGKVQIAINIFLLSIFWLFCVKVDAQSLPDSSFMWIEKQYDTGHCDSENTYFIKGDTVIDNKVYQKVYKTRKNQNGVEITEWWCAVRDSMNYWFFVDNWTDYEYLLYNFNLEEGDFFISYSSWAYTGLYGEVTKIDSIKIGNKYRKRIHLKHPDYDSYWSDIWIEGIGSKYGLTYPFGIYGGPPEWYDGYTSLSCVYQNDDLLYKFDFSCECIEQGIADFCQWGAKWTYGTSWINSNGEHVSGYSKLFYIGDTTIHNRPCKVLERNDFDENGIFSTSIEIINALDKKVYYYSELEDSLVQMFDLRWEIGDTSTVGNTVINDINQTCYLRVDSIQFNNYGNYVLKDFNCSLYYISEEGRNIIRRITFNEKFGPTDNYLFFPLASINSNNNYTYQLRCYEDYFFDFLMIGEISCDSILTGIVNTTESSNIVLYPNPLSNLLHIRYDLKQYPNLAIMVYDSFGFLRLKHTYIKEVSTRMLDPGIYFIEFWSNRKRVDTKRFVKF